MKSKLFLLGLGLLSTCQPTHAAASSESATAVQNEATLPEVGISGFLKMAGVFPDAIGLSPAGYTCQEETSVDEVLAHLDYAQQQIEPLVTHLFTADKQQIEPFLHTFIVSRCALSKFFIGFTKTSDKTSSLVTAPSKLAGLDKIIADIKEEEIRYIYWERLDEQPKASRTTYIPFDYSTPDKLTISAFRTWLNAFKEAQAIGTLACDSQTISSALHKLFQARREQIIAERSSVRANVVPGLVALRMLKEYASTELVRTTASSSSSASSTAETGFASWLSRQFSFDGGDYGPF